jgi:hypothetical protein
MRKGNALFGMYGVSAVEFAAPDRLDMCMAIRQVARVMAEHIGQHHVLKVGRFDEAVTCAFGAFGEERDSW